MLLSFFPRRHHWRGQNDQGSTKRPESDTTSDNDPYMSSKVFYHISFNYILLFNPL